MKEKIFIKRDFKNMSNEKFGKIIKDLRQKNNMTQKELGEKLHITNKAISKWERGISFPDLEMIHSISEVFGIPASDLINNEINDEIKSSNSKTSKKSYIFYIVLLIVIISVSIISICVNKKTETLDLSTSYLDEVIVGTKIANPDRIIYKDSKGNYYEFSSTSKQYSSILGLLQKSIASYTDSGVYLSDKEIDEIHKNTSFIEFDYNTISKNYIIQLDDNENQAVIKLATSGGNVCTKEISNLDAIKITLNTLIEDETPYKLEYTELTSSNLLDNLENTDSLKQISTNIYQVKIENLEEYENLKSIYEININQDITDELFEKYEIVLTLTIDYNVSYKVNLGNIRYTYDTLNLDNPKFTAHLLIVSKIVNTNCIYNTVSTESSFIYGVQKLDLDDEIFVTDFEEFIAKYNSANSSITKDEAIQIAYANFSYEMQNSSIAITVTEENILDEIENRHIYFFDEKLNLNKALLKDVEIYAITYDFEDTPGNGIIIYVDKKLGMILGKHTYSE